MLSVADPDYLHSFYNIFCDLELVIHWVGEHHIQEILHISVFLLRKDRRESHNCSISVCCECGHLGYKFYSNLVPIFGIG